MYQKVSEASGWYGVPDERRYYTNGVAWERVEVGGWEVG